RRVSAQRVQSLGQGAKGTWLLAGQRRLETEIAGQGAEQPSSVDALEPVGIQTAQDDAFALSTAGRSSGGPALQDPQQAAGSARRPSVLRQLDPWFKEVVKGHRSEIPRRGGE